MIKQYLRGAKENDFPISKYGVLGEKFNNHFCIERVVGNYSCEKQCDECKKQVEKYNNE